MYGYNISYDVDIEYADGDYESDSFDNIYNAEDFVDDCIAEGNENNNPVTYYKIVKIETDGGMGVDEEIIEESDSPKQKHDAKQGMYNYVISYSVDVEFADGDSESDLFDNIYNAEDFVTDCIEDGEYNDNPLVYYKIVKSESDGGIAVSEETIKEEEFDY